MDDKQVPHLVRLIDEQGNQIGVVTLREARELAASKELDVLIVNPLSEPPVAQLEDAGRRKYLANKSQRKAKLKQHRIETKVLKMRYSISANDYQTKLRHASQFLKCGCTVQLLVTLRGREIAHSKLAIDLSRRFVAELNAVSACERGPILDGKVVTSLLSPQIR
ncbi:MAG TPA: translation initiation factor IF-3 [Planktothrix sp.]|jgi:translation initiation factor IF-3